MSSNFSANICQSYDSSSSNTCNKFSEGNADYKLEIADNACNGVCGGGGVAVGSVTSSTASSSTNMSAGSGSGSGDVSAMSTSSSLSVASSSPSPPPSPAEPAVPALTYLVKYLGTTLVDSTNGQDVCGRAVKRILAMSRQSAVNSNVGPVSLTVSSEGVTISPQRASAGRSKRVDATKHSNNVDAEANVDGDRREIFVDIYRVAHCTVDDKNSKVFAFIARNTINDTLECFAFHCGKRQTAEVVCLTLAHAFQSVYTLECQELRLERVRSQLAGSAPVAMAARRQAGSMGGSRISLPVSTDCPYSTVSIHSYTSPPISTTAQPRPLDTIDNGDYLMDFSIPAESSTHSMILVKEFTAERDGEDEFDELARGRCGGSNVASATSSPVSSHHYSVGSASTRPIPIPVQHMEVRFNRLQLRN